MKIILSISLHICKSGHRIIEKVQVRTLWWPVYSVLKSFIFPYLNPDGNFFGQTLCVCIQCMGLLFVVYCSYRYAFYSLLHVFQTALEGCHSHNAVQTLSTYHHKVLASLAWIMTSSGCSFFHTYVVLFYSLRPHLPQVTTLDGGRECRPKV